MWVSIHTDTQKAGGPRPTGRYIDYSCNELELKSRRRSHPSRHPRRRTARPHRPGTPHSESAPRPLASRAHQQPRTYCHPAVQARSPLNARRLGPPAPLVQLRVAREVGDRAPPAVAARSLSRWTAQPVWFVSCVTPLSILSSVRSGARARAALARGLAGVLFYAY